MSALSETYEITYTIADIGKVIDCFAADLDMVAQSTGLWSRQDAKVIAGDVKAMAQRKYLTEVNTCLSDSNGKVIRAAKYEVSTDAGLWTAQRPGNNLWPRTPSGGLQVIVVRSAEWRRLTPAQKVAFNAELTGSWGTSNVNILFPTLTQHADRDYVSNGYGLRKTVYR